MTRRTTAIGGRAAPPARAGVRRRAGATGGDALSVSLPAWRSRLLLFGLFCGFASLALRLAWLQGGGTVDLPLGSDSATVGATVDLNKRLSQIVVRNVLEPQHRGALLDRNGEQLAGTVAARSVAVRPSDYHGTVDQGIALAHLLGLPPREVHEKTRQDQAFTFLRHQIDPDLAQKIEALRIPGVIIEPETIRRYSQGPVMASVLGVVGAASGQGQEGLERVYEPQLSGKPGQRRVEVDNLRHTVDSVWQHEPVPGQDITLAMDARIQYIAHQAVMDAAHHNGAHAASAVILDVRTGELLALANWPDFDPAHREQVDPDHMRNRAVADTFEPGSTLKPFSIATAIDAGIVTPDTVIDTAPGRLTIGDRTISDDHKHDALTVEQVVAKSSNVGTAKIALQMPAQLLWETLTTAGFGRRPQVELSGVVGGTLRAAENWKPVEKATIAYGYGISVSLLQLAHAYLIFARDGTIVPVQVRKASALPEPQQVISPETARRMRHMLEMATSTEGTAPAARIAGYRVAGKTGTARKLRAGHYTDSYVSSFVGFAPVSDPRVIVAVMVDDPKAGKFYGGDVAAPVFGQIASSTLRYLQVPPDAAAGTLAQAATGAP